MSARARDPWPRPVGRRERTRRAILLAAGDVFATSSVEHAKIDQIAAIAHVSAATVYAHFTSKDALAMAYLEGVFDLLERDLQVLHEEPSPVQRILGAGDIYIRHVFEFPAASRLTSVRAGYPRSAHVPEDAQALDRRMLKTVMNVAADLKLAVDTGAIPPVPIDATMVFIWGAWHGVATMVPRGDQLSIPPALAERALTFGRTLLMRALGVDDGDGVRPGRALAPLVVGVGSP